MKFHRFVADALFIGFLVSANASFATERCSLAWSHYTGWEPLGYIDSSGIAQKWGEKYGVDLNIQLIMTISKASTYIPRALLMESL